MAKPRDIVLVGAGKVAEQLGAQLLKNGHQILFVWSRSIERAQLLGQQLKTEASNKMELVPDEADLYLILVPDQAIPEVAAQLSGHINSNALVMHTSGSTPSSVLSPFFDRNGVFYPLQTFSPGRTVNFATVPICIHTAKAEDFAWVNDLAQTLVDKVYAVTDQQRTQLHLAAVFVNNFTNYLQYISQEIMREHDLPERLLLPLLTETIAKLEELSPDQAQTGPALRHDQSTMERHLKMLEHHPEWRHLYQALSKGIQKDLSES